MPDDIIAILTRMRENPTGVRYTEACKVATHFFGEPRQRGTSHRVWKMPWAGDPRINMQEGEGGKAKPYQVRQAVAAIDRLQAERSRATTDPETKAGGKSEPARPAKKKRPSRRRK